MPELCASFYSLEVRLVFFDSAATDLRRSLICSAFLGLRIHDTEATCTIDLF